MRVTEKLSKEFTKTESRILGTLSKLDEFLLNPQVRTCSVAVPRTSGNGNSENRETTGGRSSDDPYPEVGYFSHHSGHLNSPEAENNPQGISFETRYNSKCQCFWICENCFGIKKFTFCRTTLAACTPHWDSKHVCNLPSTDVMHSSILPWKISISVLENVCDKLSAIHCADSCIAATNWLVISRRESSRKCCNLQPTAMLDSDTCRAVILGFIL